MAGFTVFGLVLDFALNTIPWLTVIFTLLGCTVVFLHLMRLSKSMSGPKGKSP